MDVHSIFLVYLLSDDTPFLLQVNDRSLVPHVSFAAVLIVFEYVKMELSWSRD